MHVIRCKGWVLSSLFPHACLISFFPTCQNPFILYQTSLYLFCFAMQAAVDWEEECNKGEQRRSVSMPSLQTPLCCVFAGWYRWLWSTVTHCESWWACGKQRGWGGEKVGRSSALGVTGYIFRPQQCFPVFSFSTRFELKMATHNTNGTMDY